MATNTDDPEVGTTWDGRYEIEGRIGTGGMANVYVAEDATLGRRVAIKQLHQRYAQDEAFVERFLREAQAAAKLNHPNIVQVYDRGEHEGSYYIAMEHVDGVTLKDLVQRRGALTEDEVLAYARQGLNGLGFAHRHGVVHRDVKPHNMLVDRDGRLKISDFGIARAGADSGLTEAGSIVGTAQYLSPEQAQGREVGAPSDLYSMGVVMFEMATGRVPYDGDQPVNVALRHVNDPVPDPRTYAPDLSPGTAALIQRAMQKDPAARYQTADEMLEDLDRARSGQDTSAMTEVLSAGAVGAAAGMTGMAATNAYQQPAVAPEPAWPDDALAGEDEEDEGGSRWWAWLLAIVVLAGIVALGFFLLRGTPVDVPDVVGMELAAAETELVDAGLEVGETTREASDEVAPGLVIDQSPEGGDEADEGSEVDLVVSSGPAPVDVPDVVGQELSAAQAAIQQAGLTSEVVEAASDEVEEGFVISQDPEPGTQLAPGEAVTLTVSTGPATEALPDVTGRSEAEARELLEGFTVETTSRDSSEPAGTVLQQDPAAGTPLPEGATVILTIASGQNTVPDVMGKSEAEAIQEIEGAGFRVRIGEPREDPSLEPGSDPQVVEQDPGSVRLAVGETVEIVVGTPPAAEPDPAPPVDGGGDPLVGADDL